MPSPSIRARGRSHRNLGGSKQPSLQKVSLAKLFDNNSLSSFLGHHAGDRFVQVRIEWFSDGVNRFQAQARKYAHQVPVCQSDTLRVCRIGRFFRQRAVEVVKDRQQQLKYFSSAIISGFIGNVAHSPPKVDEIRLHPLKLLLCILDEPDSSSRDTDALSCTDRSPFMVSSTGGIRFFIFIFIFISSLAAAASVGFLSRFFT
jgi:hypothetical protein